MTGWAAGGQRWRAAAKHGKGTPMTKPNAKPPTGAGAIIALLILAGTIGGGLLGQPSIGLLAGAASGALAALLLWLRERDR